jgi:hypothetical protein
MGIVFLNIHSSSKTGKLDILHKRKLHLGGSLRLYLHGQYQIISGKGKSKVTILNCVCCELT